MKQVQKPKKPIIFYYVIALIVILLLNLLLFPRLLEPKVTEVDILKYLHLGWSWYRNKITNFFFIAVDKRTKNHLF